MAAGGWLLHPMLLMLQLYIGMALGIQADNDLNGTSGMLAPGTRVFLTCFISLAHMLALYMGPLKLLAIFF